MSKYRDDDVERLAAMFKALANPQRLRIFLRLAADCVPGKCYDTSPEGVRRCVGELGEDLAIAPSTISHHLKELRQAGLMRVERCGQKVECWIGEETLEGLGRFFADARGKASNGCRCGVSRGGGANKRNGTNGRRKGR